MPGRDLASPADFNAQFGDWLTLANRRIVRTIKARGQTLTDPAHVAAANKLRKHCQRPRPVAEPLDDALERDLADYYRAFGLIDGEEVA